MVNIVNKKAYFDYEILEKFEVGLVLTGAETKSIRANNIKLSGGFVVFHGDTPEIINVHIPHYKFSNIPDDPDRSRKILLKKREINYLRGKIQEKGLTIVPLSVYNKGRRIKLEIGLAKGKKQYDKRASLKKRDTDREIRRALKN